MPDTDFKKPHQVLFSLNNAFPSEKNNDLFFTIWYGVYNTHSHQLVYASGGHPPALLLPGTISGDWQMDQLRTSNPIMGVETDTTYQSRTRKIGSPSRLYVFSDGVYDIKKVDGSIWGLKNFLEFSIQSFSFDQPNLDCLFSHVQDLALREELEDDFTILEITFK